MNLEKESETKKEGKKKIAKLGTSAKGKLRGIAHVTREDVEL